MVITRGYISWSRIYIKNSQIDWVVMKGTMRYLSPYFAEITDIQSAVNARKWTKRYFNSVNR